MPQVAKATAPPASPDDGVVVTLLTEHSVLPHRADKGGWTQSHPAGTEGRSGRPQ